MHRSSSDARLIIHIQMNGLSERREENYIHVVASY